MLEKTRQLNKTERNVIWGDWWPFRRASTGSLGLIAFQIFDYVCWFGPTVKWM